jgi:hypothetical protein
MMFHVLPSVEYSHCVMLPEYPLNVSDPELVPLFTVVPPLRVPAENAWFTVMVPVEVMVEHPPVWVTE